MKLMIEMKVVHLNFMVLVIKKIKMKTKVVEKRSIKRLKHLKKIHIHHYRRAMQYNLKENFKEVLQLN